MTTEERLVDVQTDIINPRDAFKGRIPMGNTPPHPYLRVRVFVEGRKWQEAHVVMPGKELTPGAARDIGNTVTALLNGDVVVKEKLSAGLPAERNP